MLLTTFAFCFVFSRNEGFKTFTQTGGGLALLMAASVASIVLICILICNKQLSRRYPVNIIILISFTLLKALIVSYVTCQYPPEKVMTAIGLTSLATLVLTAYAWLAKPESFAYCMPLLLVTSCVFMGVGIMTLFIHSEAMYMFYCVLGVIIYSIYLVIDTAMIVNGG